MTTGAKETMQVQRFLLTSLVCWGLYQLFQTLAEAEIATQARYSQGDWLHLRGMLFRRHAGIAGGDAYVVARHRRAPSNLSPQPTAFGGG